MPRIAVEFSPLSTNWFSLSLFLFASVPPCLPSSRVLPKRSVARAAPFEFWKRGRRCAACTVPQGNLIFRGLSVKKPVLPDGWRKGRKIYYALSSSAGGTCVRSLYNARRSRWGDLCSTDLRTRLREWKPMVDMLHNSPLRTLTNAISNDNKPFL